MKKRYYPSIILRGKDVDKLEELDVKLKEEGAEISKVREEYFPLKVSLIYRLNKNSNLFLEYEQETGRIMPSLKTRVDLRIEGPSQKLRKIVREILPVN